jgi:anaerobic selenocysteine-containing dehydrogenase
MADPARPTTTHFATCNLCEAACGVRIELDGRRIADIRGDDDDPLSRGHVCPKAVALRDIHEDPDRLRHPMRRTANGWERVSWEEAMDEAAGRLHDTQVRHGRDAVGLYVGNPTVHNLGAMLFGPLFIRSLRTRNRFSATSVDQLPHMLAAYLMFGHQLLIPVPDVDRTSYMLMLGANPLASNGSLMTAPGIRGRLESLRKRGGKLVVIDPRRTETAKIADEHIFIRPGKDALLLASLVAIILERGARLGRLAAFTDGLSTLRAAVSGFSPEGTERHTGVPAPVVRRIADELLAADAAACYGRVGTSTQAFGGLCQWLLAALNVITGNLDREGGMMFTRPAVDPIAMPRGIGASHGGFGRWKSRVRGLPEFGGELPVAALAEEILTEGKGQIRALVTSAGNPVLSTPNGTKLDRALSSLDFMVSIDPYLNETTRHAHLILPPPSPLERSHYDLIFHLLAVRNTAKYAPALLDPGPEARHDWQIQLGIAKRLEALREGKSALRSLKYRALERLGPEGLLDLTLRIGPHGARLSPLRAGLSLARLRREVHGMDLGPLTPCLPGRLARKDKRIDLAPAPFVADMARLEATLGEGAAEAPGPLLLIGRRHVRDNNSWMHNVPMLLRGKPRCTLLVHPEDARRIGLRDGEEAIVTSRVGRVQVPVRETEEIMPGVVSLPHGYGHGRPGVKLGVAMQHAGVSINDLTDDEALDTLCGNAAFSGVSVRVERATAND